MIVLPFRLGHAGGAEPLTRASNSSRIRELKAKVVAGREPDRHITLFQGQGDPSGEPMINRCVSSRTPVG